ncbi:S-layer homology domain-containing protein [Paenibacillus elgii]|uniref:S-layer homology domain-containing protein n=1 Tax=Paenibacillus elgii TaxID=189691 RepID=UPI0013D70D59|nr:S-layer homology domain-containing protein [Paenibacillus elgii]
MKKMKKLAYFGLTIGVAAAVVIPFINNQNAYASFFQDVEGHWAKANIETAVQKRYVDGYPDGTFQPDRSVSRAEFIKMVVDALKLKAGAAAAGEEWYQPYVEAAIAAGIHRKNDFSEHLDEPITRQEMSRVIVRATNKELQKPEVSMDDRSFLYNATRKGLIQGLAKGELGIDQPTTRAQAVTVIERIMKVNEGEQLQVDQAAASYAEVALRGTNLGTVFNAQPKILPMPVEIGGNLKAEITQIIVVDMSNPESAYYEWFKEAKNANKQRMDDKYLIALHLKIENKEAQEPGFYSLNQSIYITNYVRAEMPAESSSPVKKVPAPIPLDKAGSYDGWYLSTATKDFVKQGMDRVGFENPEFSRMNGGGSYDLTEMRKN